MAVAVHQHQVFATDHGVPDDLVRGGSAIDHEEGMVGAEIARGTVLGLGQGAGMVEQRAQLGDRDRQVGTQRVLPEELVERLSHRTLAIGDTAAVARRMPGIVGLRGVLDQRTEEWRQQPGQVVARRPGDLAGEERHGVFEQVEDAAQLVQVGHGLSRRVLDGHLLAEGEDRQCGARTQATRISSTTSCSRRWFSPAPSAATRMQARPWVEDDAPSAELAVEDAEAVLIQFVGDALHAFAGNGNGLDDAGWTMRREI